MISPDHSEKRGRKTPLVRFEVEVGNSEQSATIVVAGCGNGKTTAAYRWSQRSAVGKKLWFTYPTTRDRIGRMAG